MLLFLGNLGGTEILIVLMMLFLITILPIYCLIDIARNTFKGSNDKLTWILLVIFLGFFGCIAYLLIGKKQIIKNEYE